MPTVASQPVIQIINRDEQYVGWIVLGLGCQPTGHSEKKKAE
jgi:hypothetical protein